MITIVSSTVQLELEKPQMVMEMPSAKTVPATVSYVTMLQINVLSVILSEHLTSLRPAYVLMTVDPPSSQKVELVSPVPQDVTNVQLSKLVILVLQPPLTSIKGIALPLVLILSIQSQRKQCQTLMIVKNVLVDVTLVPKRPLVQTVLIHTTL
jgi:hypothetical protein